MSRGLPSPHPTTQYASTHFLESCGAILFHASTRRICLLHHRARNVHVLAKGRRNVGESRASAAIREVHEETGLPCRLLPVTLHTRCPPAVEGEGFTPDQVRRFEGVVEPFMVSHRVVGEGRIKMIWWFVGAVEEDERAGAGEKEFDVELLEYEKALEKLTYEPDREVVRAAIAIFTETMVGREDSDQRGRL